MKAELIDAVESFNWRSLGWGPYVSTFLIVLAALATYDGLKYLIAR